MDFSRKNPNRCHWETRTIVKREYIWTDDLSGKEQGAGGVGGLAGVILRARRAVFPIADPDNGNITAYLNKRGRIAAKFAYSPFGQVIASRGWLAHSLTYRFSTKPYDKLTNLVHYTYREYSPVLGRWTSRDPIAEQGGLNLYAMVGNDVINKWDIYGLQTDQCPQCHQDMYNGTHYHVCNGGGSTIDISVGYSDNNLVDTNTVPEEDGTLNVHTNLPGPTGTGIFPWFASKKKDECAIGKIRIRYKFQSCYVLCCSKDGKKYRSKGKYVIMQIEKCKSSWKGNVWRVDKNWN